MWEAQPGLPCRCRRIRSLCLPACLVTVAHASDHLLWQPLAGALHEPSRPSRRSPMGPLGPVLVTGPRCHAAPSLGPTQPGCQRARVTRSCPGPVRLRPLLSPGRHLRSAPTRRSDLCACSRLRWSDAHLPVWLRPPSRRQRPLHVCPGQRRLSGRCSPCSWLHHVRALTWHRLRAVPSACSKGHTCQAALGPSTHRSDHLPGPVARPDSTAAQPSGCQSIMY